MSAGYVLVVDDEPEISRLVREILEDEGYTVAVANNAAEAREARRQRRPDLILLDVWMPDVDGLTLLREWSEHGGLASPVVMISGHGTVETAVEAIHLGAYDFLEKPLSLSRLLLIVKRAIEADRLHSENVNLKRQPGRSIDPIGRSAPMENLREQIKRVAGHSAWVLISGEPGSGKESFARYLHAHSGSAEGPFIEAGIAAVAGQFAASELFGSESGSEIHYGLIEQANGGTLYLSEVGDIDLHLQGLLLNALQNKAFTRQGGKESVHFDARIIAATHFDLEERVQSGRFREDLYYQLDVVPLRIPPLREHPEDIPLLLDFYVQSFVQHDHLPYRRFSVDAVRRLCDYHWGGNVRELINFVQRMLILGKGDEIGRQDVEAALGMSQPVGKEHIVPEVFTLPLREARASFEKDYFNYLLETTGGQMGQVARRAGVERTHLYRKFKALGLKAGGRND